MPGQLLFANGCGANGASVFCPTDANGVATIDFVVTRQPGDNFAIAASTTPAEANAVNVNGIELTNAAGANIPMNCPTEPVCRSQMLTVWRRLHIEVDSMGVSQENRAIGTIRTTTRFRTGESRVVELNPTTPAALEPNRFEGGVLISGGWVFDVVCNLAMGQTCNTADTVTLRPRGSQNTLIANTPFELYDDDDFNDDDGTLPDGDTGENIPSPDDPAINATALMQSNDLLCGQMVTSGCNVFASSYVHPLYDISTDATDDRVFQSNIEIGQARGVYNNDFDQRATVNSPTYWTIVLYGAYQGPGPSDPIFGLPPGGLDGDPPDSDGDGNPPIGCPETAYGQVDQVGPGGLGAGIFTEVLRPREYPANYTNYPLSPARSAAHEVGHLFGGIHGHGGLMEPSCGASLVTGYTFDPRTIALARTLPNP